MESIRLYFKTLWSPGEAMFLFSKKPKVLLPLILVSLLQLGVGLVSQAKLDFGEITLRQLERSPQAANMTEEQKQNAVSFSRRFAPVFVVIGTVTPVIIVVLATLVYFGLFSMVGRTEGFKAFFGVTLFAYIPLLVRQVVSVVQLLSISPQLIDVNELGTVSLSIFLDRTEVSKLVYAAAGMIDLTSIWTVILLIIGYKFLTPKSMGTGLRATVVVIPYLCVSLLFMGLRMLQAG